MQRCGGGVGAAWRRRGGGVEADSVSAAALRRRGGVVSAAWGRQG